MEQKKSKKNRSKTTLKVKNLQCCSENFTGLQMSRCRVQQKSVKNKGIKKQERKWTEKNLFKCCSDLATFDKLNKCRPIKDSRCRSCCRTCSTCRLKLHLTNLAKELIKPSSEVFGELLKKIRAKCVKRWDQHCHHRFSNTSHHLFIDGLSFYAILVLEELPSHKTKVNQTKNCSNT